MPRDLNRWLAALVLVAAFLATGSPSAVAAEPVVSDPASGVSAWSYKDLHDDEGKYEGGYARFDDTATASYTTSPHGGYNTTTNKCKVCHATHRAEGAYSLVRAESQEDACAYCHVNSAHSSKTVYDANSAGMGTNVGHRIGARSDIPASTSFQSLETTTVAMQGAGGVVSTVTVEVRSTSGQRNKLFRLRLTHGQTAAGDLGTGYQRLGPMALTCTSCHQVHNATNELWRPRAFGGTARLEAGYKLLKASPSGSVQGPDGMFYDEADGTTRTVSYTSEGMRGYKAYTGYRTTGLVNARNVVRVPETTLTPDAYGPGKTTWDSPEWGSSPATAAAGSPMIVDQYALSVWCADCHNLAVGTFDHSASGTRTAGSSHEASGTHSAPFAGATNGPAQCYTCHRGDLSARPATPAIDPSNAACERCHYGTGSFATDAVRMRPGGADWPHSDETSSAYMLGAWTVDASGSVVATRVTEANAAEVVCNRCHTAGRPAHESAGGADCYTCHAGYRSMDSSSADARSQFHHVLGTAEHSGDTPKPGGSYPSSTTEVYCTSCHVDHDVRGTDRGANLRASISSEATANSDYSPAAPYGICLSCHTAALPKSGEQKAGGSSVTPAIPGADYGASAHSYTATSTFGASAFKADCSKCHTDSQPSVFQTSQTVFSLHLSPEARLLAAFGLTVPIGGQTEEALCYGCHSGSTPGPDYYAASMMSVDARGVRTAFEQTGSSHPVGVSSGVHRSDEDLRSAPRHVECEDCHQPHAAKRGVPMGTSSVAGGALYGSKGVKPVWPANWTPPASFDAVTLDGGATDGIEAFNCLKCHSGNTTLPPSVTTGSGTYAPTDVAREFNPNNFSFHNVTGQAVGMKSTFALDDSSGTPRTVTWARPTAAMFQPGYTADSMLTCTSCHTGGSTARGPHGSSAKWLIDPAYPTDWKTGSLSSAAGAGMTPGDVICAKCHDLYDSDGAGWGNGAHAAAPHSGGTVTCTACHIKIPHGWQRPRLLGYTSDPAEYRTAALQRIAVTDHTVSGGVVQWQQSDCQSTCHGSIAVYWP